MQVPDFSQANKRREKKRKGVKLENARDFASNISPAMRPNLIVCEKDRALQELLKTTIDMIL